MMNETRQRNSFQSAKGVYVTDFGSHACSVTLQQQQVLSEVKEKEALRATTIRRSHKFPLLAQLSAIEITLKG